MASTYCYRNIVQDDTRSIRILKVHGSSSPDARVECEIIETNLGETKCAYEAISYCWGGQKPSRPILCDGETLLVTQNCDAVLRRFRHPVENEARFLWIDFICINQTDVEERSHQVKLMGEIYRNAECTLIWLGEETDNDSDKASFDWLVKLADAAVHPVVESRKQQILQLAHTLNTAGEPERPEWPTSLLMVHQPSLIS